MRITHPKDCIQACFSLNSSLPSTNATKVPRSVSDERTPGLLPDFDAWSNPLTVQTISNHLNNPPKVHTPNPLKLLKAVRSGLTMIQRSIAYTNKLENLNVIINWTLAVIIDIK